MDINPIYSVKPPISIPGYSTSNYNKQWVSNYVQSLVNQGSNLSGIGTYTHGQTIVDLAYAGGVYSPTQNRIYFVPYNQQSPNSWHYMDCNTGTIVAYTAGVGAVANAYFGGAYCPTQNRVYFIPYFGAAPQLTWHFLDMQSNANTSKIMMSAAEYNKL